VESLAGEGALALEDHRSWQAGVAEEALVAEPGAATAPDEADFPPQRSHAREVAECPALACT
jgi:hypothetical protein